MNEEDAKLASAIVRGALSLTMLVFLAEGSFAFLMSFFCHDDDPDGALCVWYRASVTVCLVCALPLAAFAFSRRKEILEHAVRVMRALRLIFTGAVPLCPPESAVEEKA